MGQLLRRIVPAHFHELRLLTPLRHGDRHFAARFLRKPPAKKIFSLRRAVQRHTRRNPVPHGIVALNEFSAGRLGAAGLPHEKCFAVGQAPVLIPEHFKAAPARALRQGDHVLLRNTGSDDFLPLSHSSDGSNSVADARSTFKFQPIRCFFHPAGQFPNALGTASPQKFQCFLHRLGIFLFADLPPARGTALLDIIIQARSPFSDILRETARTGRQAKNFQRFIHRLLHRPSADIRTDIFGSVVGNLLSFGDPGPWPFRYTDIAVALVIFQKNIVLRAVLLDETAFQYQRFKFAVCKDIFKIIHMGNHLADFFVMVFFGAKILADPVFQGLGLSDINNLP